MSIPLSQAGELCRIEPRVHAGKDRKAACGGHHQIPLLAKIRSIAAVRLHHFAFQVETLDELFEVRAYLKERGIPMVWEGRRAMGGHTSVEFLDPDGYHVELYCDMDQIPPGGRSRPRDPNARYDTLEKSRDNPKPPTW